MLSVREIYHEYLKSDEWNCLRELAKFRNKRKNNNTLSCVDCGLTHKKQYDVHHEHYPESNDYYSDDNSSYHVVLCRECHEKRHGLSGDDMLLKIDKKRSKKFLSIHAAFFLYNPYFLDNYINTVIKESFGFDEYADLFALIVENSKNNDNIKDFMCKLSASNIDKYIIKEFAISTISFNDVYDEIIELKKECDREVITSDTIDNGMVIMLINSKKRELDKKQKEAHERMKDVNKCIISSIKKHQRKLKRVF